MTIQPDIYLAIDQGGQSSRASLYDHQGNCLAMASHPVTTTILKPGWIEQETQEVIASIKHVVNTVLNQGVIHPGANIKAGLATQRSSITCWDKLSSQPLSNIISWQDSRAAQWLTEQCFDPNEIHQISGLKLSPHFGASKLHWCLQHIQAVKQAQTDQRLSFGPMTAYLIHMLLLEHPHLIDTVNAARTQCLDIQQLIWSDSLLQLFDLPQSALPQTVPTKYHFGHLAEYPAIPLTTVTGDQSAALYAFGKPEEDNIYINIGTGAFVLQPTGTSCRYHEKLLTSLIRQDEHRAYYALEGTINGAGAALNWLASELQVTKDELLSLLSDKEENYATIPLFINTISGLGSPFWQTALEPHFIGESSQYGKARAVLESIIFLIMCNIEVLQNIKHSTQIIVTGGLSRLNPLCQWLADLSKLNIIRPDVTEATSRGLAFQLAGMPEDWPDMIINQQFLPRSNNQLETRYLQWRNALQSALDSVLT